jgi:Glycosyl transferase family 2
MSTAVVTFVYNEAVNLPIWLRYYGEAFGDRNLFVIDHSSTDGSTANLGDVNRLWLAREELDEHRRCVFMASFAKGLLEYFDTVIYTDCDEMLVPDPAEFSSLKDYLDKNDFEYMAPVGLNVHHIMSLEPALDLTKPILRQRRFARFTGSMCKPLITRIPLIWGTGFHACNQPIRIDPRLFLLHLKAMDYDTALKKQKMTREMKWAASSLEANHGVHARYDDDRFVRELFLDPGNLATSPQHGVQPFEFSGEIARIKAEMVHHNGIFHGPHFNGRIVELPDRMRDAF